VAPGVVALLAFLGGSGTAGYALPALAGAAKAESVVAGVYADLPAICAASDPLVDRLGDLYPKSATLARLAAVADAVCAAAARPDNPVDQAELVIDAIAALTAANARIAAATGAPTPQGQPAAAAGAAKAIATPTGPFRHGR